MIEKKEFKVTEIEKYLPVVFLFAENKYVFRSTGNYRQLLSTDKKRNVVLKKTPPKAKVGEIEIVDFMVLDNSYYYIGSAIEDHWLNAAIVGYVSMVTNPNNYTITTKIDDKKYLVQLNAVTMTVIDRNTIPHFN